MRRDWNTIRGIALELEGDVDLIALSEAERNEHLLLMIEDGLLDGEQIHTQGGPSVWLDLRLTNRGHEFLALARNAQRFSAALNAGKSVV